VVSFQEAIRRDYPDYQKQNRTALILTPAGVQAQSEPTILHRFSDTSAKVAVVLAPDFLALETMAYTGIDDFGERLLRVADAVRISFEPAQITRIGLRFINELRFTTQGAKTEMRDAITQELLGPAGVDELQATLVSTQQVLEFAGNDHRMLVRHGLNPSGGTTVDVLPVEGATFDPRPFYLLDIDVFTEQHIPYHLDGIDDRLGRFNDLVRTFFAWAIREPYRRSVLGQQDLS